MNIWKELEIDSLLPDILTGDYEFEHKQDDIRKDWTPSVNNAMEIIHILYENRDSEYRYRKSELKQPTGEILAENYVKEYDIEEILYDRIMGWMKRAFIAGRESAEISPEGLKG